MPIKHTMSAFIAATLVLCAASSALAQHFQPFGPQEIEYDFQLFAPAELGDFGDHPEPNVGLFAAYDRIHININRSADSMASFEGDWAWGNRYELGYMTHDRHGWLVNFWNVGSPNAFITEEFPRDFFQSSTVITPDDDTDGEDGEDDAADDAASRNQSLETLFSDLDARSAENDNTTHSLEVNKTFRLRPTHRGMQIEPFFGARYVQFRDKFISQRLDIGPSVLIGTFDVIEEDAVIAVGEITERVVQRSDSRSINENNMVGGQIGSRFFVTRGRWTLTTELRAFGLHNFASVRGSQTDETITVRTSQVTLVVPGTETETTFEPTVLIRSEQDFTGQDHRQAKATVFGGELRLETAYNVTRDIALRVGFEGVGFADGVARGQFNVNDDLLMFGVTMGVQINR